jgi:hypothetical protein
VSRHGPFARSRFIEETFGVSACRTRRLSSSTRPAFIHRPRHRGSPLFNSIPEDAALCSAVRSRRCCREPERTRDRRKRTNAADWDGLSDRLACVREDMALRSLAFTSSGGAPSGAFAASLFATAFRCPPAAGSECRRWDDVDFDAPHDKWDDAFTGQEAGEPSVRTYILAGRTALLTRSRRV